MPLIENLVPGLTNARWVALRLLDGDHKVREALLSGELADLAAGQRVAAPQRGSRITAVEGAQ